MGSGTSLADLREDLHEMQRKIDISVSRAAIEPGSPLDVPILPSPGALVFGVPAALKRHCKALENVTYLYLIDEFENFDSAQQQYVNSLIRERRPGITFMIGVRTFGLRTPYTLNPEEANKRGAEIDEIDLDRGYSRDERVKTYEQFCRKVVARRLAKDKSNTEDVSLEEHLGDFFENISSEDDESLMLNHDSGARATLPAGTEAQAFNFACCPKGSSSRSQRRGFHNRSGTCSFAPTPRDGQRPDDPSRLGPWPKSHRPGTDHD